ncbi:AMP-binding protein [Myxococcota bacterium]|nr:AMP-binding protein [Myxococcota bacterium]
MGLYHAIQRRWADPEALHAAHGVRRRIALGGESELSDLPPGGLCYADLELRVRGAAGMLRGLGLRGGDVVALQLPRSLALVELLLGALGIGAAVLLVNDRAAVPELRFLVEDSGARLAVVLDPAAVGGLPCRVLPVAEVRERLDQATVVDSLPEPDDEALAALMYTSGTTGRPKGAMLSHKNLLATIQALHQAWGWSVHDHLLHALPLHHIHGLVVAQLGALWAGARTTWMSRFDAAGALTLLQRERCTVFMGVPTFYHRFLSLPQDARFDLSSMRLFTCGSAPLPAADLVAFRDRFGHTILERYGMTECGIVLSNPLEGERRPGSVGFPLPGVHLRIVDPATGRRCETDEVGEIRLRGPSVTRGYLGRAEQTAEALVQGWLHTGDLARADADGYVHVVGRIKELIISGGFNVYPGEVEAVLQQAPGVAEAAVLGLPDADLGERVVAALVARPGRLVEPEAVLSFARQQLAAYKCPREVVLLQELPRNAMGKVQKNLLARDWPV